MILHTEKRHRPTYRDRAVRDVACVTWQSINC